MEQTLAILVPPIKEEIVEVAEIVDFPFSQMMWEIVEVIQPVLVARIKDRISDHIVDILVHLVIEEIVAVQKVVSLVRQERVQRRLVEQTVEVGLTPTERVQQRIDEQIVEMPIPQITEDIGEEFNVVPHRRRLRVAIEKYSSKEEFWKHELGTQLDGCSKKIDALREPVPPDKRKSRK